MASAVDPQSTLAVSQEGRNANAEYVSPALRFARLFLSPLARFLKTGDEHASIDRFFTSHHVHDLHLIVGLSAFSVVLIFAAGVVLMLLKAAGFLASEPVVPAFHQVLTVFASTLGIFGAIVAWAYRIASERLGVVDLFACEIGTLCRVTTVADAVRRYVSQFDQQPPAPGSGGPSVPATQAFSSQENYFPVFESCTRDLQTLGDRVVIDITAFYTFMKAVRDLARGLSGIGTSPGEHRSGGPDASAVSPWHNGMRNLLYMLFLGMESARESLAKLVEFEPEKAHHMIVVLISELEAYAFLWRQFPDEQDVHHQRLALRIPQYRCVVPEIQGLVKSGLESGKRYLWEPARPLLPELDARYQAAMRYCENPMALGATN